MFGLESVEPYLRLDCEVVTRKGSPFDQDFVACFGGFVETAHHEMQIRRQGLHDCDFFCFCSDDIPHILTDVVIGVQPGWQVSIGDILEVAKDALLSPGVEVFFKVLSGQGRLQSQGVPTQVYRLLVVFLVLGNANSFSCEISS